MSDDRAWRTPNSEYTWSQDYTAMLDAMVGGAVMAICLYETFRDGTKLFDACFMMCRPISYKHVEFVASARGIEYFSARDDREFIELCAKHEVSFLDPKLGKAVPFEGDCIHCGDIVSNNDVDHWKFCSSHPANAEIARLRAALAPILAHAEAPDTAPPLRISVRQAREIMEDVENE
jgi:hypothetical protein